MTIQQLIERLTSDPDSVEFQDVISLIEENYEFTPTEFQNGKLINSAGENSGSCKIFSFAQLHELTQAQTLACFGHYYRDDVLANPNGEDHGNIRNFIKTGWGGIQFNGQALATKS